MNKVSTGLLLVGAMLGIVSCGNENEFRPGGPEGKIVLDLTTDSRVIMNTRADDSQVSVIPEAEQFAISFEKQDGSFSKTWSNLNLFNKESGFPIGTYTISASFGDKEVEGFELPYFYAENQVTVESGTENRVSLHASLANSMVSVRYTDDFKSRFAAYSASLKAESGSDWVVFAKDEDRPAYMKPEKIDLRLTLTNAQGKKVEVAPYSFTARPQYHYIVTLGVSEENETGDARLDVQITEEVESEFIDINLGDDLFNAPAPVVKAHDFPADMSYDEFAGFDLDKNPRIDVLAYAGLRKVNMTVTTVTPLVFGNSVQFVGAPGDVQAQVASTGLVAEGFYRNPDKAGVIKFKEFLKNLPAGTYKFHIDVEDVNTHVCDEPVEFTVTIHNVNVDLKIEGTPKFLDEELTVSLTTNNPEVKEGIRFEVKDGNEQWTPAEVITTPAEVKSRSNSNSTYTYRLKIPAVEHSDVMVRALAPEATEPMAEVKKEGVIFPEYSLEIDPYSFVAYITVIPSDAAEMETILRHLKVNLSGKVKTPTVLDAEKGKIEVELNPATDYTLSTFLAYSDNPHVSVANFRSETGEDVPNGCFNSATQTINFTGVQIGGKYRAGAIDYTNQSSIVRNTPDGWATVNDLTCWAGSSNINTWFIVPSTYVDNGKAVIQSVGYSHNGTTPARSGSFGNTKYYCENTPSDSELSKAAGEMFLGKYSFGSSDNSNKIVWGARPESLTFTYSYESVNNESGEAYLKIIATDGTTVLGSGKLALSSGTNVTKTISLPAYNKGSKAGWIELGFRSTQEGVTPKVNIPTGSALKESGPSRLPATPYITTMGANDYHAVALGSKLTIDDVKLNYQMPTTQASEVKRRPGAKSVKRNK